MGSAPILSVVIPTYNRPGELRRALSSVVHQNWRDRLEVVVVDDGSDPPATLDEWPELPNLSVIRLPEPQGASAARNRGVEASSAPLIAFLDDDDEWLHGKLEAQWRVLQDPGIDFTFAGCALHTEGSDRQAVLEPFMDAEALVDALCFRNVVVMSTLVVRRSLFEDVGGFDERFQSSNDWDLCLRLAMAGMAQGVPGVLARWFSKPGRSSITGSMTKFLQGRRLFLQKHGDVLSERRGALARHHLHIGQALAMDGRRSEARNELRQSIAYGGLFFQALGHLVLIHTPRAFYQLLTRLAWWMKGYR
jgi:glycosyltransferase involved in cell wall biosynthesis